MARMLDSSLICTYKNFAEIEKMLNPNYFTDVSNLIGQLNTHGVEIVDSYYFLRRGDFPKNIYEKSIPKCFYEYALISCKVEESSVGKYDTFSSEISDCCS